MAAPSFVCKTDEFIPTPMAVDSQGALGSAQEGDPAFGLPIDFSAGPGPVPTARASGKLGRRGRKRRIIDFSDGDSDDDALAADYDAMRSPAKMQLTAARAAARELVRDTNGFAYSSNPKSATPASVALMGDGAYYGNPILADRGLADADTENAAMTDRNYGKNKSMHMGTYIDYLIHNEDSFYTGKGGLFPIMTTDSNQVDWETWTFAPHVVPAVAEFGAGRIMGSKRHANSFSMDRFGLAIRVSKDMWYTKAGKEYVAHQIKQMWNSIAETNNYSVVYALVTSQNVTRQRLADAIDAPTARLELDLIREAMWTWDVCKAQFGLEKLDAHASAVMQIYGGTGDAWVVPLEAANFMALDSPARTSAAVGGAVRSERYLTDGGDAFKTWSRGKVYVARSFIADEKTPINPLQFAAAIGEHYTIFADPNTPDTGTPAERAALSSIEIYDEPRDRWARISLADVAKNDPFCGTKGQKHYDDHVKDEDKRTVGQAIGGFPMPGDDPTATTTLDQLPVVAGETDDVQNSKMVKREIFGTLVSDINDVALLKSIASAYGTYAATPGGGNKDDAAAGRLAAKVTTLRGSLTDTAATSLNALLTALFAGSATTPEAVTTEANRMAAVLDKPADGAGGAGIANGGAVTAWDNMRGITKQIVKHLALMQNANEGMRLAMLYKLNVLAAKYEATANRADFEALVAQGAGNSTAVTDSLFGANPRAVAFVAIKDLVKNIDGSAGSALTKATKDFLEDATNGLADDFKVAGFPAAGKAMSAVELLVAAVSLSRKALSPEEIGRLVALASRPFEPEAFKSMHAQGVILPIAGLVLRPHMRYSALALIKMQSKGETGHLWVKPGHFSWGEDALHKEVVGSYTYNAKAVVEKPRNVMVVRNGFINGYLGGGSAEFYDPHDEGVKSNYMPQYDQYVSEDEDSITADPSLFAVIVPLSWAIASTRPSMMVCGSGAQNPRPDSYSLPIRAAKGFPGRRAYDSFWGWSRSALNHRVMRAIDRYNLYRAVNLTTFDGFTRRYNPTSKSFGDESYVEKGCGHWAASGTYLGCARVRRGDVSKSRVDSV